MSTDEQKWTLKERLAFVADTLLFAAPKIFLLGLFVYGLWIFWPIIVKANQDAIASQQTVANQGYVNITDLGNVKIIRVYNDNATRYTDYLQAHGYEITKATRQDPWMARPYTDVELTKK